MEKITMIAGSYADQPFAEIRIEGHETMTGIDDAIVYIECDKETGQWMLYVWHDINREDPVKIELCRARKSNRWESKLGQVTDKTLLLRG